MHKAKRLSAVLAVALTVAATPSVAVADSAVVEKGIGFSLPFNSCNNEAVFINGAATHTVTKVNADGSNRTFIKLHGTATTQSGNKYVYNSIQTSTFKNGNFVLDARQVLLVSKGI
jgi:hypothetical protein